MRTGFRVEAEGAEAAEVLELGQAFAVELVKGVLSGWCLDSYHDVRLWLIVARMIS